MARMRAQPGRIRRAITLVELLVVMSIIVLILGVALPLFSVFSENRSVEAASNHVSAMLGRAHAEARGLQRPVGVVFFIDPDTEQTAMIVVTDDPEERDPSYLEVVAGYEIELLPKGTAAQFIYNGGLTPGGDRSADGYIHPRRSHAAIMFDGYGQLISQPYNIRQSSKLGQLMGLGSDFRKGLMSQFGMVLYNSEAFSNLEFSEDDPITAGGSYSSEKAEEDWLDENGMPLMVNQYNGTLFKAENVR